jgi:hypothetical protein
MRKLGNDLRRWWSHLVRQAELRDLAENDAARIAGDAGVSIGDLYALDRRGPDAAAQLPRRLRAVHLDPDALAVEHTAEFRDMQRLCSLCESKGRCERDLSRNPRDEIWSYYCPNASTIDALRGVRRD